MKLLFDQNISNRLIAKITHLFPHAKQVKELKLEGATDRQIWEYGKIEKFTIITFDSDWYDLSTLYGHFLNLLTIMTTKIFLVWS